MPVQPASHGQHAAPGAEALAMHLKLPKGSDGFTLGRAEGCELYINDATLSQKHLVIKGEQSWIITDLGSTNGSWINEIRMVADRTYSLNNGSQVQAGRVYLTFLDPRGMFSRIEDLATHQK